MMFVHTSHPFYARLNCTRTLVPIVALVCLAAPRIARAQITSHLILVAPPVPNDPTDSALAFELANDLRKAVRVWGERRVPTSQEMCDMLRASDYPCHTIMPDPDVERLADALHTDAFVTGTITRDTVLTVELRITARNRTSYAGSFEVLADINVESDSIAKLARRGLDAFWFSAKLTRHCYEARDEGAYEDAVSLAQAALSTLPNHSAAALCLATVYELTDESITKRIQAYAYAFQSDRRLLTALRRLTGLYLEYGDTLSGTVLLGEQLRREPEDAALRMQLVHNWITLALPDSAFAALRSEPNTEQENLVLIRLIAQTCLEREMWWCHFEALERQVALDPSLAQDTTFYYRIVGAAQQANNPDGILRWTKAGIERAEQVSAGSGFINALWLAHAAALVDIGDRDSAVAVYLRVSRSDQTHPQPLMAAAGVLADLQQSDGDSTLSLDTTLLRRADSVLSVVADRGFDASVLQNVSTIYFTTGAALVQHHLVPRMASQWLEKAVLYDTTGRTRATASALNALALAQIVQQLDTAIRGDGTCDMVDEIAATIDHAREATVTGREAMPDAADQIQTMLGEYTNLIPQYRAVLGCER